LAVLVSLIGLLTLTQYVFGWDLAIDELLFDDPATAAATTSPGRMGLNTSIGFATAGATLLLLDTRWGRVYPHQVTALAILIVAFVALVGYLVRRAAAGAWPRDQEHHADGHPHCGRVCGVRPRCTCRTS
jgi:hypothetical protein